MQKITPLGAPIKQGLIWAQQYRDIDNNVATVYARKKGDLKRHINSVNAK